MYKNLGQYIEHLESQEELVRITVAVDPVLEIAEITDRVSKSDGGGKALLFENTGTGFPVLTNMMGSDRRIAMALGVERVEELGSRIRDLLGKLTAPKNGLGDKLRMLPLLGEVARWLPRRRKGRGECQEVVMMGDDVSLGKLPILQCWPHDGGRFVTLPLVHTIDPDTGSPNVGMYRMQVLSKNTTGMHWHLHKTGERHYQAYKKRGERMPVTVCLGGDPAYTYAATAPMPDNLDEYMLAGFLRSRKVDLVKCLTNELYVPADCDFVIEGYVDPAQEKVVEGPFGDHTGFYSLEDTYPVFHITAITHRRGAVYPATIVGVPPQEDAYIATATEAIFLEPIRFAMQPEVEELYMPVAGVAHNIAVVNIRKSYIGQGFKVASSMWGAGQMMFNKFILIASTADKVRDPQTLARLVRGVRVPDDVMMSRGVLDVLDHATPTMGFGGKMALDATSVGEVSNVEVVDDLTFDAPIESVDVSFARLWAVVLLRCGAGVENGVARGVAAKFITDNQLGAVKYVVLVDPATEGLSGEEIVWLGAGNCSPDRDITIEGGRLIIDARSKVSDSEGNPQRWPNVVTSSAQTIALVDSRWAEYGIGEFRESPSVRYSALLFSDGAKR